MSQRTCTFCREPFPFTMRIADDNGRMGEGCEACILAEFAKHKPVSVSPIEEVIRYRVHECDFRTREDAQHYVDSMAAAAEANAMWKAGATLSQIQAHWPAPEHAYRWGLNELPESIAGLTRAHLITISHWQCSDKPAYRLIAFEVVKGRACWELYVGGSGGWSGFYGRHVRLRDLARYAERGIHLPEPEPPATTR